MDAERFDSVTRAIDARSRRRFLGTVSVAGVAVSTFALAPDAEAKKHKKNKKKCRKPAPPSCTETCPSACAHCFLRPGATMQCGTDVIVGCDHHCTSDDDCVDTGFPFCVTQVVDRATGQTSIGCGTVPPAGLCHNITGCS